MNDDGAAMRSHLLFITQRRCDHKIENKKRKTEEISY